MVTSLLLTFMIQFPGAGADTADVIGQAGELGYQTGTRGAVANRRVADELYKQALENERKAWQSTPPDVALLAKALQQSKDAKAADDQAKEHARAALHSANTGAHSGDFINQRYGMISESKIKELANTNSPYQSQVEKTLGGYGLKLDADKMILQTPIGKFAVNAEDSTLLKAAQSLARSLGYDAKEVEKGQQSAIAGRDEIAKKTVAGVDAELAERGKNKNATAAANAAAAAAAAGRALASLAGEKDENGKTIGSKAGAEAGKNVGASGYMGPSLTEAELENLRNRRAMGLDDTAVIGRASQDIFLMIHTRYQSINSLGLFFSK